MSSELEIKLENTDFMKRTISELEKGVDNDTLEYIGYVMGTALGTYAPEVTGALRQAYDVEIGKDEVYVTWGGPTAESLGYVKYQFYGEVMGPNNPIFRNKLFANDFKTPKGMTKYPTGRELGQKKTIVLDDGKVIFIHGYSKPGSTHHWIEKARKDSTVYNPMRREVYEILADAIGEKIVGKRFYHNV